MTVLFLDVAFDQCHTPRWTDATPILERMVCGEPAIPGRTYCAACREVLIAGVLDREGRPRWFNSSTDARWRAPTASQTMKIEEPDDGVAAEDPTDPPDPEVDEADEIEPDGDCPLQPADLCDWGMAA